MMKDPLNYLLPLEHPSLEHFISIEELPNGLPSIPAFSAHPDIDKSLSRHDAMPKSHPSVTALLIEHLPPHHPLDLDEMLRDPQLELPLGHPSLSLMLVQEVTESDVSRSFRKASEIKLSVFSSHPDLAIHKTQKSIKHHPTIDHLFADVLPPFHPNLDELMEEGFTLPSWHPDIAPMVELRDQTLSPGALLCYAFSALFLIAVLVRNTKSWINSMSTKETLVGKQTNGQSKHSDLHSTSSNEGTLNSTFKSASDHASLFDGCSLDNTSDNSSVTVPLPKLDYRNATAMELNKLHHDENLTSEVEPIRASIISYQEKKNTKLRSTCHSALGRRICGTHLSNGGAIFRLFYVGVNLAALFLSPYDINVGLGSLAAGNIVFLVTAATKNSAYTWLLGIAFDQTVAYHRFIGYITVGVALVHACFYFNRLMDLMSDRVYKTGFIALMFGIILVISSLNWIRRRYFNVFYYSHAAFIGFIVCVYMHAAGARPFILASIGFYALDKMLHFLWTQLPRKTLLIEKVGGLEGRDTAFVRVGKTPLNRILGRYKVGQYVFVNFPSVSLTEWHPYSVASGPSQEYIE